MNNTARFTTFKIFIECFFLKGLAYTLQTDSLLKKGLVYYFGSNKSSRKKADSSERPESPDLE